MQIGARIGLEKAERRGALVDLFRIRKFARVGHAFVVIRRKRLQAESLRQDEMASEGDETGDQKWNERHAPARSKCPGQTGGKPKRQWRGDQIGGRKYIHRQKEHQAAKSGPGEVGEIDAAENAVAPEKDASEEKSARQERRQLREENRQQLPLLRRVGDEEDCVEAEMLHIKVGADGERAKKGERNGRGPAPIASEPVLGDGHHRAREAEAQHRQAHHQRAEMRPAADGEDPHDVDLQRNDRAGAKTHGEIEPKPRGRIELRVRLNPRLNDVGRRDFACVVHCVSERPVRRNGISHVAGGAAAAEAILASTEPSCCACQRSGRLQAS